MMTYKKPAGTSESFLRPSRTYHDFEIESGIDKKVNCLIAFAAVALIVALAALSLSIMVLFQAFQTAEMEVNKLSVLEQRIKQLEEQMEHNGSKVKILLPSNLNHPIMIDGKSESNVTSEHTHTNDVVRNLRPSETHPEEAEDPKQESNEHIEGPLQKSTTPDDSHERTDSLADDGKNETQSYCPQHPRPDCPVGYTLQNTDDPCPRSFCHPGDDEGDNEGSGEECPDYPRPVCPSGFVVELNGEPCPRPVCRKPRPGGLK